MEAQKFNFTKDTHLGRGEAEIPIPGAGCKTLPLNQVTCEAQRTEVSQHLEPPPHPRVFRNGSASHKSQSTGVPNDLGAKAGFLCP